MITIREADLEKDAPEIMEAARDFVTRVTFQELMPKDDAKLIEAVGRVVTLDGFELLIAEFASRIVGVIGILYVPYHWNPDVCIAEEIFWWTAADAPFRTGHALIEDAMKRIKERGAVPMFKKLENSPDGVARMYEKHGLSMIESVWGRPSWQH